MKLNGVAEYTEATVSIFFPGDHVCCGLCPLLETYSRLQCRRTGEYLLDKNGTGMYCPLTIKEKE